MEVVERSDGVTVVNDAYNASPESMKAALTSLGQIARGRRAWAVLGEMRELGSESDAEHQAVGRLVDKLGIGCLVVVGDAAAGIATAAQSDEHAGTKVWLVPDPSAASQLLLDHVEPGDVVLVKASRAVGLELVAEELLRGQRQTGDSL